MSLETSEALAGNAVKREADYSNLPSSSLIDDANTQLSIIFNSSMAQYKGSESQYSNFSLIVYCPLEGGESVIDSTVHELAQRSKAVVQTIDIVQYINKQPGAYWKDSETNGDAGLEAEKNSGDDSDSGADDDNDKPSGYFKMRKPLDSAKLSSLIETTLTADPENAPELDTQLKLSRHIIYLRDFGFMATFSPECFSKVISAICEQQLCQPESTDASNRILTAIIIGASPLPTYRGMFQKPPPKDKSSSQNSCCDLESLLETLNAKLKALTERQKENWGEGENADKLRTQRLHQQHEMWNNGTLVAHIRKQLAKMGVLGEAAGGRSSRSKHIPICIVVPAKQNPEHERLAREKRRLELNQLHVQMTLLGAGGELSDVDHLFESGGADRFATRCKLQIIETRELKRVAERAVGTALASSSDRPQFVPVPWNEFCSAWGTQEERDEERSQWLRSSSPTKDVEPEDQPHSDTGDDSSASNSDEVDLIVEKLKKQDLDPRQKGLLDCLVRPADIQTGFDAVHLPDSTIDTIRTLVSLRLVCPEAFQTGILKQYNMSGVLLFGPPGTGKTLLAKAIAKEAEVRMCVGEEEKNIDALFKLARQLKPCVIFVDEVDALFGSRISAKGDNLSRWRTDMLTQFTQEMDGMLPSDVIVIGASNRPFDLDDAIIRRLPCRIFVDLPDTNAREAILGILLKDEKLESDVRLTDLAALTPHFSGSDLKHVCVMAAYESAKEMANVSWANKKGKSATSVLSTLGISIPVPSKSGQENLIGSTLDAKLTDGPTEASVQAPTKEGRKLSKRHFTLALKQVRASTSETQTSLVELRRWNEQFGSGSQSNRTGGYGIPGLNLSRLNMPGVSALETSASGTAAPWMNSSGAYRPGMSGVGTGIQNMNMSGMNPAGLHTSGMNPLGMGTLGTNAPGVSFVPPVEGSYLRSLGIQI
ncbi:hypothetical protein RSOLAG22IIIB_07529 [Rhizoctonia solani]|uniref:AAA+ ATPase domain-containing protein n=1 Tax=Rhizoctonia solani TaxID=456999 RepID=A0A0K6FNJ9_9AGAM|nr:hypothetical protein RSOLAG22IIIB_07529 [Rhizoctonia solani]